MLNNDRNLDIFEVLVKQNYQKVYQMVFCYTKDKFISEDAVQQAFVIAYNKLNQLNSKDKFASWVISIALNEAKRMLKEQHNPKVTSMLDLNRYPDRIETVIELKEDINNALSKLKQKDTEILLLKYYADLTLKQIANLLDLNISSTKVRLHRAKEKFRELIENDFKNIGG
ncbi:RNA polymerase sigma factor [Desulfosporosinus sp. SYSU MS00001]|uniref:RNA polymerase sigma factor n=1 Tax=Desulfosporosinus sp. SYSU MS00001 TaxID=3416284 RepID=UPI003CE8C138